jgi:hypothetical protein
MNTRVATAAAELSGRRQRDAINGGVCKTHERKSSNAASYDNVAHKIDKTKEQKHRRVREGVSKKSIWRVFDHF